MLFKQFHLESLGHASYFIGSEQTGETLVLDVRRDVDLYFAEARAQGMRIRYAADTHQHNDYLSGICELPARGEIQLLARARAELGYPVRQMAGGCLYAPLRTRDRYGTYWADPAPKQNTVLLRSLFDPVECVPIGPRCHSFTKPFASVFLSASALNTPSMMQQGKWRLALRAAP
jgi:hypothetical protein